jgi:hypothetical protein
MEVDDDQDETSKTMCNETMSNEEEVEEEMDNLSQFYGRIALRDEEADENGNENEESMNEEESKNGEEWTAAVAMSPQQNDNAEEEQPSSPVGLHVVEVGLGNIIFVEFKKIFYLNFLLSKKIYNHKNNIFIQ